MMAQIDTRLTELLIMLTLLLKVELLPEDTQAVRATTVLGAHVV
jgi:hypothetical protein